MPRRRFLFRSACALCAVVVSAYAIATRPDDRPVESLLPADSLLYIGWDGTDRHKESWEKTAAFETLDKSGLLSTLTKIGLSYIPASHKADGEILGNLLRHIARKGISVSLSVPSKSQFPLIVVVLHDSAALEPVVTAKLRALLGETNKIESRDARGRKIAHVRSADASAPELAWWIEGSHLVVAIGQDASDSVLDIAEGKAPAIPSSNNWRKFHGDRKGVVTAFCAWLDVASLKSRFGDRVLQEPSETTPRQTVEQLMQIFGVERVGSVVCRCGFRDQAVVTDLLVEAPSPRTGLLALADQRPITLTDLPPLPKHLSAFSAYSFDWSKAYDVFVKLARDLANSESVNGAAKVDAAIAQWPPILGFDLKRDLLDPLGGVICLYSDTSAPIGGTPSFALALQVKDAATLKKTAKIVLEKLRPRLPQGIALNQTESAGRDVTVLHLGVFPLSPALCIDKNWFLITLSRQSIQTFLSRVDGEQEAWKPSAAEQAVLNAVPRQFVGLTLSDPAPTYTVLVGALPFILLNVERAIGASGTDRRARTERMTLFSQLPPPDELTRSLFPNVSAWTVDAEGLHSQSRGSAPSLISGQSSIAMTGIGVALLLPAVQAAREAARRTQSRNNIKQIAAALEEYHRVHKSLPPGTMPNAGLKPEKRLSWQVAALPFLDPFASIYKQIDLGKSWDDAANRKAVSMSVGAFQNPSANQETRSPYPVTNYVGLAGLGEDGPTLPVDSPRAGCFAYDRTTRFSDITDGLSTTAMISEASKDYGSWAAGGRPTIRSLTTKPYINGPDGLGGWHSGSVGMGFADGGAHFLSTNIDPAVIAAMMTIRGGEKIDTTKANVQP